MKPNPTQSPSRRIQFTETRHTVFAEKGKIKNAISNLSHYISQIEELTPCIRFGKSGNDIQLAASIKIYRKRGRNKKTMARSNAMKYRLSNKRQLKLDKGKYNANNL